MKIHFKYKHSLRKRFTLAATYMLAPLVIMVAVQYLVFNSTITHLNQVINHRTQEMAGIKHLQNTVYLAVMCPNDYLVHANKKEHEIYNVQATSISAEIDKLNEYMGRHEKEKNLISQIKRRWIQVDQKANTILTSSSPIGNKAMAIEMESLDAVADEIILLLGQLYDLVNAEVKEELIEAEYLHVLMIGLIIGGTSVSAILIFWLNITLAQAVVEPICTIGTAANRVGEGNYSTRLSWQRDDEIGALSKSFDGMTEQLEQAHDKLEALSRQDGLTGCLNRREFDRVFRLEFSRASRFGHRLSLIMIDLDHFKEINDKYGHLVGDNVLRTLTKIVESAIRDIDQFARYGGEEFALILPEVEKQGGCVLAERIKEMVEQADFGNVDGEPVHVTISVGVADYPEHGGSEQEIIDTADKALYQAKHEGRNRVVCANVRTR